MRKLSLGHFWFTTEKFLKVAFYSNIFLLSFVYLNFWKFEKSNKMGWNSAQMNEAVVVDE